MRAAVELGWPEHTGIAVGPGAAYQVAADTDVEGYSCGMKVSMTGWANTVWMRIYEGKWRGGKAKLPVIPRGFNSGQGCGMACFESHGQLMQR